MRKANVFVVALVLLICTSWGCSKRQLMPGILAGMGGAALTAGVIYRATLPEEDSEGLFGKQAKQKAGTATLMFTGLALILTGVIWSATTPVCELDLDCWHGDVCETATKTCVPRPLEAPKTDGEPSKAFLELRLQDRIRLDVSRDYGPVHL